jgi:hypothetical protein
MHKKYQLFSALRLHGYTLTDRRSPLSKPLQSAFDRDKIHFKYGVSFTLPP